MAPIDTEERGHIATHPHVAAPTWYTDTRNTLYIARTRSAYTQTAAAGGGRFPLMRPELQLTRRGHSRSVWSLPPGSHLRAARPSATTRMRIVGSFVKMG